MRIKSKKGAVLLLISSVGFLIAVILLVNYQLKAEFLGQKQVELLDVADEGEDALFYIDQMVRLSLAETWGSEYGRKRPYTFADECRESITVFNACLYDFKEAFESVFTKKLVTFNSVYNQNLKYNDFDIGITPYGVSGALGGLQIKGTASKNIVISFKEGMRYSVKPNFHIKGLSLEELDLLR